MACAIKSPPAAAQCLPIRQPENTCFNERNSHEKNVLPPLLPLLLTACGVALPPSIHIDAREQNNRLYAPDGNAAG